MLETMSEDYIRTARAKGLPERVVILKHALRGALTPVLTIFGLDVGLLLGGAVLTEKTFSLNGLGKYAYDGIVSGDLPKILGVTLVAGFFVIMANSFHCTASSIRWLNDTPAIGHQTNPQADLNSRSWKLLIWVHFPTTTGW
jgi:ABC-type microcin C transport system permease subunit YejB